MGETDVFVGLEYVYKGMKKSGEEIINRTMLSEHNGVSQKQWYSVADSTKILRRG